MQKYGVSSYKVSKETGVSQTTLSDWKRGRSTPKTDNMKKIADYFGITMDYLMTGKAAETKETTLTPKEDLDLSKKLDMIIDDISSKDENPLFYKGKKIDDKSLAVLEQILLSAMKQMEIMNDIDAEK